jgi:hypothetical protein
MRGEFYSREQLMTMPLKVLRGVNIETPEQELLVQEVVTAKLSTLPPQQIVSRKGIPDIQTQEDEAKYQAIMDERTAALMPKSVEPSIPTVIAKVEIEPTNMGFNPLQVPLAEPTGEGEPVKFQSGVNVALQGPKIDKRTKEYKNSLK